MKKILIISFLIYAILSACSDKEKVEQSTQKHDKIKKELLELNDLNTVLSYLNDSLSNFTENSQSIIDSLNYALKRKEIHFNSIVQLSTGEFQRIETEDEDGTYGFNYRIEVYLSEIYKSIYLTRIEYFGEGMQRISSSHQINIEDELGISSEQTSSLNFLRWNSLTQFQISIADSIYNLQIIEPFRVIIK